MKHNLIQGSHFHWDIFRLIPHIGNKLVVKVNEQCVQAPVLGLGPYLSVKSSYSKIMIMQYAVYYLVQDHLSLRKHKRKRNRDNKSKRKLKQSYHAEGTEGKIYRTPPPQWQWACPDSGSTC